MDCGGFRKVPSQNTEGGGLGLQMHSYCVLFFLPCFVISTHQPIFVPDVKYCWYVCVQSSLVCHTWPKHPLMVGESCGQVRWGVPMMTAHTHASSVFTSWWNIFKAKQKSLRHGLASKSVRWCAFFFKVIFSLPTSEIRDTCICGYWNQTKFPLHKVRCLREATQIGQMFIPLCKNHV